MQSKHQTHSKQTCFATPLFTVPLSEILTQHKLDQILAPWFTSPDAPSTLCAHQGNIRKGSALITELIQSTSDGMISVCVCVYVWEPDYSDTNWWET